jgi:hypothetical protein
MRRFTRLFPIMLFARIAVLIAATPIPAAHAESVPEPEDDPFYAVPADVASYDPGEVIDARRITALVYVLPVPADTWQILYRTNDSHGEPTATVTTLIVPKAAWNGIGPRPLVSYQTAEDGVAGRCAPSYGLRAGLLGSGLSNASAETGLMFAALTNNWAVTVPDYEGPDSQFLAALMEGQAVLDGIRASLRWVEAGLPANTPVGIWGYSGGAFATSIAGQLEAGYAPEINMQAIAVGGVVAEIRKTIDAFSGSPEGGAIAMGINGPIRAFPEYDLGQYLSESGRTKVAAASRDCITDAVIRDPFLRTSDLEAFPGVLDVPAVASLLHANSPLGIEGTPTAPVYDYHATLDELAPIGPDRALMRRYCAGGAVVQHVEHLLADHISETVSGATGALAFLQRFAGKTPKNTCTSIPGA